MDEKQTATWSGVDSTRVLDFSVLTKKDFDNAAMIVVTVPDTHYGYTDLMPLCDLVPRGCLIAFIRPGETIQAISEDQMREMGWVKSNPPSLPRSSGGTDHE